MSSEAEIPEYVLVKCYRCGTRMHPTLRRDAYETKCPDCYTMCPVPPLAEVIAKLPRQRAQQNVGTYSLNLPEDFHDTRSQFEAPSAPSSTRPATSRSSGSPISLSKEPGNAGSSPASPEPRTHRTRPSARAEDDAFRDESTFGGRNSGEDDGLLILDDEEDVTSAEPRTIPVPAPGVPSPSVPPTAQTTVPATSPAPPPPPGRRIQCGACQAVFTPVLSDNQHTVLCPECLEDVPVSTAQPAAVVAPPPPPAPRTTPAASLPFSEDDPFVDDDVVGDVVDLTEEDVVPTAAYPAPTGDMVSDDEFVSDDELLADDEVLSESNQLDSDDDLAALDDWLNDLPASPGVDATNTVSPAVPGPVPGRSRNARPSVDSSPTSAAQTGSARRSSLADKLGKTPQAPAGSHTSREETSGLPPSSRRKKTRKKKDRPTDREATARRKRASERHPPDDPDEIRNPTVRPADPRSLADRMADIKTVDEEAPPKWLFFSETFTLPFRQDVLVRWLLLSLGMTVLSLLSALMLTLYQESGGIGIAAIAFIAMPAIWIFLWSVSYGCTCGLAILIETAAGSNRITAWPEPSWKEWMIGFFYVMYQLIIAGVMASALAIVFSQIGGTQQVWSGLLTFLLFPIVLLSSLEANSAFIPLTEPILRSLVVFPVGWFKFYCTAFLAGLLNSVAAWFLWEHLFVLALVSGPLQAAFYLIYPRLLGRLAWKASMLIEPPEPVEFREDPHPEDSGKKRKRRKKKRRSLIEARSEI